MNQGSSEEGGVAEGIQRLQKSLLRYFDARFRLLHFETAEAAIFWRRNLLFVALAAVFALIGWLFVLVSLVPLVAGWLSWKWEYAALAFGGLHLLLALLLFGFFLFKKNSADLFKETLASRDEDQADRNET